MNNVCEIVKVGTCKEGYDGEIEWETTRSNSTPQKLLDVSKATALGWTYKTELRDGIRIAYEDFLSRC
jgi:GDP-L-fucose synthase